MDEKFLGDSFDLVKRFFAQTLSSIATVYADGAFVPEEMRTAYSKVTGVPIFDDLAERPFALLLDPCTGIRVEGKPTKNYVSPCDIARVFKRYHPQFLVCFDQSFSFAGQKDFCMEVKMRKLTLEGLHVLYYASHANFLFAAESHEIIDSIRDQLLNAGIPAFRLKSLSHPL